MAAVLATGLTMVSLGVGDRPAHADSYDQQIAAAKKQAAAAQQGVAATQAEVTAAQSHLQKLQDQAEAAAERYNAARIKYAAAQRQVSAAKDAVAKANQHIADLQKHVAAFAAAAYRTGGLSQVKIVTNSNPEKFLDKMTGLEAVAHGQQQIFEQLAVAHHQREAAEQSAERARDRQKQVTEQIKADREAVQHSVAEQQSVLQDLQQKEAQLQAAEQAAERRATAAAAKKRAHEAAVAAAKRAAELRRQQEAAAAAARQFAAQAAAPAPAPAAPAPVHGSGGAAVAVQWAYRELGKPYVWGAEGPNTFDCSGLTKFVWAKAGVYLDHYTGLQWNEGAHVPRSQAQPGDLVFFGSDLHHVGLYIGDNKMIEAPHTGANVRISYAWRSDLAGVVRPGA